MKIRAKIIGPKVHNVGYRYLLLNEADNLGLKGFSARNAMENGNQIVSILIEGDEKIIAKFREFVQINRPETAEVAEVSFENFEGHVESVSKFAFRFQSIQVGKGINSILKIESVQYNMLKNQDRMLETQDRMLETQDRMLETQDESVELLKGVKDDTSAIRDEIRQSASSALEEKYEQLSREIAEIKASISEIKARVS
jgi:acylphosphatase